MAKKKEIRDVKTEKLPKCCKCGNREVVSAELEFDEKNVIMTARCHGEEEITKHKLGDKAPTHSFMSAKQKKEIKENDAAAKKKAAAKKPSAAK